MRHKISGVENAMFCAIWMYVSKYLKRRLHEETYVKFSPTNYYYYSFRLDKAAQTVKYDKRTNKIK